ncbi:hypothetical protein VE04_00477 [Pseudogymnoascus sp. 24MN13]|nr:hypothetical protein VE04_00477 [Pseudogymnoascus sp. 24MN13]
MTVPRQQNAPPNPSAISTAHGPPTTPSLPKDYKKVVKSLIRRRDISLEVKIDLWKRFAEYEACVDEESHNNDEEEPVFTNTNATTVGEIGPDVEMPVPWMEDMPNFGSAPISGAENIAAVTSNGNQEADIDAAITITAVAAENTLQPSNPPTTTFTQVRSDIRSYFATLAKRERLLASREKWLANRAEALWRNAQVLAEILGRGVDRKERKRVVREFGGDDGGEEDEEEERGRKRTRRV